MPSDVQTYLQDMPLGNFQKSPWQFNPINSSTFDIPLPATCSPPKYFKKIATKLPAIQNTIVKRHSAMLKYQASGDYHGLRLQPRQIHYQLNGDISSVE